MKKNVLITQEGFTLIEVLISIVILSIGLIALNLMQVRSIKGNATGNAITQLSWIAADSIESLQLLGYSALVKLDGDNNNNAGAGLNDSPFVVGEIPDGISPAADYPGYTVFWNTNDGSPDVNTVSVRLFVVRNRDNKQVQHDFFVADFL